MATITTNTARIAPRVLKDIVESLIENNKAKDQTSAMVYMQSMSEYELFDTWLNWIGIIGFTDDIIMARDTIRASKQP